MALSCESAHQEAAIYLLDQKNADPNSISLAGSGIHTRAPPILLAARSCYRYHGGHGDDTESRRETRSISAAEIITKLLEYGAKLSITDPRGSNALFYISHLRVADALLGSKDAADVQSALDARTPSGKDALIVQFDRDADPSIALAKRLVAKGADVQRSYGGSLTPLHWAALYGDSDFIDTLLEYGANIDVRCEALGDGNLSALHIACMAGAEAAVKCLLARNASREARTNDWMTPLHIASAQGYCSILELLLAAVETSCVNSVSVGH